MPTITKVQSTEKKTRNREESSLKILKAGLAVFSEVGYDVATTKMISKRAGVAEALIHRYYINKAGLLKTILSSLKEAEDQSEVYKAGLTLEEEIRNFFADRHQFCLDHLPLFKIILSRALVDQDIAEHFQKTVPPVVHELRRRIENFKVKGMIHKSVDVSELTQSIVDYSLSFFLVNHAILGKNPRDIEKTYDSFAHHLVFGLKK